MNVRKEKNNVIYKQKFISTELQGLLSSEIVLISSVDNETVISNQAQLFYNVYVFINFVGIKTENGLGNHFIRK